MINKRQLVLFLGLILVVFQHHAQTGPYPHGAYMNLAEIGSRKPSNPIQLEVIKRSTGAIKMNGGNDYKLESFDNAVPKKVIRKEVLGYSKGDTLFINGGRYKVQNKYCALLDDGRYLVFKGGMSFDAKLYKKQATMAASFGAIGAAIGAGKRALLRFLYAIDTTDNSIVALDQETITELLKTHEPALLERYRQETEPKNQNTLLTYIKLLNDAL